jgi:hypothetical protein
MLYRKCEPDTDEHCYWEPITIRVHQQNPYCESFRVYSGIRLRCNWDFNYNAFSELRS